MSSLSEVKNAPFAVSQREVDYFKQNYSIHYRVLQELIASGQATVKDAGVPG